ncbi:PUB domain family protein [Babesia bovis T2Bo]|uniref:PUB domain family protein n=1 Tax=Babesia bovis T2Bo TaxID=484906 RepID=UPI001DD994A3|nr:PUB domain family protein [Babesia bovis T2Bo]EDO05750.2 PUB domain family protein [Babesia bovis T2Bo]
MDLSESADASDESKLFETDEVKFTSSFDSKALVKAISDLRTAISDDKKVKVYKLLLKIVENILLNPWGREKRRIRESNSTYSSIIGTNVPVLTVLNSLGFRSVNGFAVLRVVDVPLLRKAYQLLITALKEDCNVHIKSLEGHFFDPFKAYQHSSDVNKNANTESFECLGVDRTKSEILALEKTLSASVQTTLGQWNPVISFENAANMRKASIDTNFGDTSESTHSTAHIMKIYNVGKCRDFESSSRKYLDQLQQKCEYVESNDTVQIKIRFPGNTVITIYPPVRTLVSNIKSELQSILISKVGMNDWELVEMPLKQAVDENKTLLQQDIVHSIVLQFRYKVQRNISEQIIKPEVLRQYCPTKLHS